MVDLETINLCQLDDLGLSCMGCCGHDYTSQEDIEIGLKENTDSFDKVGDSPEEKKRWGMRKSKFIRYCGICCNLIRKKDEIFCPLHPLRNEGVDLRDDMCEKDHKCKTKFLFDECWDDEKRKRFLGFIKGKNLDWYTYSMGMDSGSLLDEFEEYEKDNVDDY